MLTPAYDSEIKGCSLCGAASTEELFKDFSGNIIHHCANCGVQFMNPQYTDEYLDQYYSGYILDNEAEVWRQACHYGFAFYLEKIEAVMKKNSAQVPGRLFDFGCGCGLFLEVAQKRGWTVEGYDVSESSTTQVAQCLEVPVHHGDIFKVQLQEPVDLLIVHQVLEHLKEPRPTLEHIKTFLKPGGFAFIAVPNILSLSNRFKYRLETLGLRKKRRGAYYDTSHHLFYYSPESLRAFLESLGFEVLYTRNSHKFSTTQSDMDRWLRRNLTEKLVSGSSFFMVVRLASGH